MKQKQRGMNVAQLLRHLAELNDQGFGSWPVVVEGHVDDTGIIGCQVENDHNAPVGRVYLVRLK